MPSHESSSSFYDNFYKKHSVMFGGGKPQNVVQSIPEYMKGGRALALGEGEGRNALFLAKQGFEVTAQDMSQVGIEKMRQHAEKAGVSIQTEVGDARTREWKEPYNAIVNTFMLHHVRRSEALALIQKMQEYTAPGGLNAVAAFTKNGDFFKGDPDTQNFYLDEGELRGLYEGKGWEIVGYTESEGLAFQKAADGRHMTNVGAHLLARKPEKTKARV